MRSTASDSTQWKLRWDEAMQRAAARRNAARAPADHGKRRERESRLAALQSAPTIRPWAQPYGYPVQLFGPWTRTEGPWKHISDFLLRAHRDHIHLAK